VFFVLILCLHRAPPPVLGSIVRSCEVRLWFSIVLCRCAGSSWQRSASPGCRKLDNNVVQPVSDWKQHSERSQKKAPPPSQKLYKSLNWATNFGLHRVRCRATATQAYDLITVSLPGSLCLLKFQPPPPCRVARHHAMGVYGGAWMYNSSYLLPPEVSGQPHVPAGFSPIGSAFSQIDFHTSSYKWRPLPEQNRSASWLSLVPQVTMLRCARPTQIHIGVDRCLLFWSHRDVQMFVHAS
jgi:hypothetical protein